MLGRLRRESLLLRGRGRLRRHGRLGLGRGRGHCSAGRGRGGDAGGLDWRRSRDHRRFVALPLELVGDAQGRRGGVLRLVLPLFLLVVLLIIIFPFRRLGSIRRLLLRVDVRERLASKRHAPRKVDVDASLDAQSDRPVERKEGEVEELLQRSLRPTQRNNGHRSVHVGRQD